MKEGVCDALENKLQKVKQNCDKLATNKTSKITDISIWKLCNGAIEDQSLWTVV